MEKTVCYFSQTCRKLADMARALQVMTLAQGNKYKEELFYQEASNRAMFEAAWKLTGHGVCSSFV